MILSLLRRDLPCLTKRSPTMVANVPPAAARSTAMERRLRLRRQEARLRLKLLADSALLEAHHASQAPGGASNNYIIAVLLHGVCVSSAQLV